MNSILLSTVCFLALISTANAINCVVCTTGTTGCSDPYTAGTSQSSTNYDSCYKDVYGTSVVGFSAGYVDRGGISSGDTCTAGSSGTGATRYCCSNTNYCNGAMGHTPSMFAAISLMIAAFIAKQMFLH